MTIITQYIGGIGMIPNGAVKSDNLKKIKKQIKNRKFNTKKWAES